MQKHRAASFPRISLFAIAIAGGMAGSAAWAQAPAPAPAAQPPKPADPAFLAAEKAFLALDVEARRAIQRDLMWVAKFEATASGDFGPLTFAALKRFETEAKLSIDGILTPAERERLAKEGDKQRLLAKFTVETDKISGMKIGIPGAVLTKSLPNSSGGTRWQDKDEKVTLDLTVYKKDDSLATLFEKGTDAKAQGRKITYKLIRPDFFVISGETASGKFYRRAQADAGGAVKGFSIGYDKSVAPAMDKMVIAIAASFEPFGKAGGTRPESKPGSVPVAEAPSQRRATGLVIPPQSIYTPELALKGCTQIRIESEAPAEPVDDKLIRRPVPGILALPSQRAARAPAFRIGKPVDGPATLIQRDAEGALLASAATIEAGKVATSLQVGGAGGALFDRTGALVGIINQLPVMKFRVAGVVPMLRYAFMPASEALKVDETAPSGNLPQKSAGDIAETVRASVVSLVCASDK